MKSKSINFVLKKLIFFIIIMALFTSFAFADDFVVRDAFTGEPINGDDNIIIDINSSVSYDKQKDMYIYSVTNPNSSDIKSNVYDGMVVNFPVSIDAGNNIYIDVYKDGKKLSNNNYDNISDSGSYKVFLNDSLIFHFTIVGKSTGIISSYTLPEGFKIYNATFNGDKIKFRKNYISLSNEGRYVIDYKCTKTGVKYKLATSIDNTAPVLELNEVRDGFSTGPVDISDIEKDIDVKILFNGKELSYRDVLKDSGEYSIILTDQAGNVSNYEFTIKQYFNMNIAIYVLIIIIILISIIIYAKASGKRTRIR